MADFAANIKKWVDKAKDKGELAFRNIALAAVERTKELTPVDTGFLRANWVAVMSVDAIPKVGEIGPPKNEIMRAKLGDIIYIVNPVQYARAIEYGFVGQNKSGKYVNRPGRGMVAQTITELPQIADRVVNEIKRR